MQKGQAAILLLVGMLILVVGGYLVYINNSNNQIKVSQTPQQSIQPTPKPTLTSAAGSIQRCGDIPDIAFPSYERFEVRKGPEWSADCQHIAWSMWQSGTGCPNCSPATLSGKEGIFIYNAKNKTVTKIYNPSKLNESPEFIKWSDNDNFSYRTSQKEYNYNLQSQKATQIIP